MLTDLAFSPFWAPSRRHPAISRTGRRRTHRRLARIQGFGETRLRASGGGLAGAAQISRRRGVSASALGRISPQTLLTGNSPRSREFQASRLSLLFAKQCAVRCETMAQHVRCHSFVQIGSDRRRFHRRLEAAVRCVMTAHHPRPRVAAQLAFRPHPEPAPLLSGSQQFHQPQPGTVHDLCHEPVFVVQTGKETLELFTRQPNRQMGSHLRTSIVGEVAQFHPEHFTKEKDQHIEGLPMAAALKRSFRARLSRSSAICRSPCARRSSVWRCRANCSIHTR
jgi:hypothetical protein